MRLAGALLAFAILIYGAFWLWHSLQPPPQTRMQAEKAAQQRDQDCRDLCEQTQIVEKLDDEYLRKCRARCDADRQKERENNYQPIKRITVAPADHRREPAK